MGGQSLCEDPRQGGGKGVKGVSDGKGELCPPDHSSGGSFGQGKGLKVLRGLLGPPRAHSQLPPWTFRGRKVKEEKLSLFPDPGKRCLPWASACPGPGWGIFPLPRVPQRAATSPGPCPA